MAPEILQGAVTFYQESFLRADMYSMGLLFWDLLSRTKIDETTGIFFSLLDLWSSNESTQLQVK